MIRIVLLLLMLAAMPTARADTSVDLVRVSCVPEAGLLDVEYRSLHDSVATGNGDRKARGALLARAGFHDPHGLNISCRLGDATYTVSASQDPPSQKMCGAAPEVYLTITRGSEKLVNDTVFGDSCNQLPSITRVTIGDGPQSRRGRETQLCYTGGKDHDPVTCDWTFGKPAEFAKHFPVDQERLEKMVRRLPPSN